VAQKKEEYMNPFKIAFVTIPLMHAIGAWMVLSAPSTQETVQTVEDRVRVGGATVVDATVQVLPVPTTTKEKVVTTITGGYSVHCTYRAPWGFDGMITNAARRYKVNARALALTVYRESGCKPSMVGSSGEIGLGQIMPTIWTDTLMKEGIIRSSKDLYDPQTNLYATAWILRHLRSAHKDPYTVFMRYNGSGPKARLYASQQMSKYRTMWGTSPSI
jgi:hypothetical protein